MALRLKEKEIRARLIRLDNLEYLHTEQKVQNTKLRAANRQLTRDNKELVQRLENALVRIEDLETMIFGRQRKPHDDDSPDTKPDSKLSSLDEERLPKPPRRPNPKDDEVTSEPEPLTVNNCKHCDGPLSEFMNANRFVEDIDITALIKKSLKTVTKLTIERGKCQRCGKWTSAADLRGQTCTLGPNVKLVIPYLITVLDQTYQQVQTTLQDFFGLSISDAEITRILANKGAQWRPEYSRIDADIRGQPGNHLDETTWNIQEYAGHCYAWIKTGTTNANVLFRLTISRGGQHAKELLGNYTGVRITDGYSVYTKLPGKHQLCWAHLIRKARDLARLTSLPQDKQLHCQKWYGQLCEVYQAMVEYRGQPFNQQLRQRQAKRLLEQVCKLCQPHILDPHKLKNLKQHMLDFEHALFTCLTVDGIPPDNNRAERDLRPLVIKRKKSFGSKTEHGAKALEVILSVVWSTWRQDRNNFWEDLQKLPTT